MWPGFNEKITISDANVVNLIMKESNPIDIGIGDHKTSEPSNRVRPET